MAIKKFIRRSIQNLFNVDKATCTDPHKLIEMLLMVERGIRGEICHSINRCAKANNKYIRHFNKNKEF